MGGTDIKLKPGDEYCGLIYLGGGYYRSKESVAEIIEELIKEGKLDKSHSRKNSTLKHS
jgi:polyhydroxyalkanoate synthesis regulator phasin